MTNQFIMKTYKNILILQVKSVYKDIVDVYYYRKATRQAVKEGRVFIR
jgi:hypothetical protein